MEPKELPSTEMLRELFHYDGEKLIWKKRLSRRSKVGTVAGCICSHGYYRIGIHGKLHFVHRIIWKMTHGADPAHIDHIDGNPLNNRIENLRSVTKKENNKNARIRRNNTSGMTGVSWRKKQRKWLALITANGKQLNLGTYDDPIEAGFVRRAAEKEHGYHPNHGRALSARKPSSAIEV